jgi:hypothetical protein
MTTERNNGTHIRSERANRDAFRDTGRRSIRIGVPVSTKSSARATVSRTSALSRTRTADHRCPRASSACPMTAPETHVAIDLVDTVGFVEMLDFIGH